MGDCYISQIKVRLQKSVDYHIPDECLLSDSEDDNVEDDLLDQEILESIQEQERTQKQQEIEEKKRVLQEKIDTLQEEIQELTDERDKL